MVGSFIMSNKSFPPSFLHICGGVWNASLVMITDVSGISGVLTDGDQTHDYSIAHFLRKSTLFDVIFCPQNL